MTHTPEMGAALDLIVRIRSDGTISVLHVEGHAEVPEVANPGCPCRALTVEEREIVRLLGVGHSIVEIARRIARSERSTYRLVARMTRALDARNRAGLIRHAERCGLLDVAGPPAMLAGSWTESRP